MLHTEAAAPLGGNAPFLLKGVANSRLCSSSCSLPLPAASSRLIEESMKVASVLLGIVALFANISISGCQTAPKQNNCLPVIVDAPPPGARIIPGPVYPVAPGPVVTPPVVVPQAQPYAAPDRVLPAPTQNPKTGFTPPQVPIAPQRIA